MKEMFNKTQERIIKILMKKYPVTIDEIVREMGMRKDTVEKEIKKLVEEGIIGLDILPDKIFVRLLRRNFMFFKEKNIDRNIIVEQEAKNLKNLMKNENIGYV